jgi:hypothetical protein
MSQDLKYIKQCLESCEEIDSPYELTKNCDVQYITLKDHEEYFFEGGSYQKMGDNRIILKKNNQIINVPLEYLDKEGHVLYKTRLFMKKPELETSSEKELRKIIKSQQRIIEKLTEQLKKK